MMRFPYCGPVARPKLGLPTTPFTAKFVLLKALKAVATNCSRILLPSPVGHTYTCLMSAMLSTRTGGCRNLLLYCEDVPNANCPGTEKAATLKYRLFGLLGSSAVRLWPVLTGPPLALHIRASVNSTPLSVFGQLSAIKFPLR